MDFLIRFSQVHESFRKPEIEALVELLNLEFEWLSYSEYSPFALIRLPSRSAATTLIHRSILAKAIYSLWGYGITYPDLHQDVHARKSSHWQLYTNSSFRFDIDTYLSSRSSASQHKLINSFAYLNLQGPISMKAPEEIFTIFEDYSNENKSPSPVPPSHEPRALYFGRLIAISKRLPALQKYSLKSRNYLSTTSMDSELALITANLTHASPGKILYDPFTGTGSLPLAAAHFGAYVWGSDIDGRMLRGKGAARCTGNSALNVRSNFAQYGLVDRYLDGFISDLTHHPFRSNDRFLDGILCDPPYGVREGLKVLGNRESSSRVASGKDRTRVKNKDGVHLDPRGNPAWLNEGYIPPKKPYSFVRMLDDILAFAAGKLVDGGRLSLWMPVANDEDGVEVEDEEGGGEEEEEGRRGTEYEIPRHPCLRLKSCCVQEFNKWSRRLLTYERVRDEHVPEGALRRRRTEKVVENGSGNDDSSGEGITADELNPFRKRYFQAFRTDGERDAMRCD